MGGPGGGGGGGGGAGSLPSARWDASGPAWAHEAGSLPTQGESRPVGTYEAGLPDPRGDVFAIPTDKKANVFVAI